MRLLADENFPLPTVEALRQAGHDVNWARTDAPGTGDTALLELAEGDDRVLLTLDKDFWQIAIQRRQPPERSGVILFRAHPAIPENVTPLVLRTMATQQDHGVNSPRNGRATSRQPHVFAMTCGQLRRRAIRHVRFRYASGFRCFGLGVGSGVVPPSLQAL